MIGVGGYSSGPVVLAAALRGIPTMLLEQNAVPGLTNRLLAKVVSRGGGHVRFDGVVLRQEGLCRRESGSTRSSSVRQRVMPPGAATTAVRRRGF